MALSPRRFTLWPRDNLSGRARPAAFAHGVEFTDGTVVVQWVGPLPHTVVYRERGIDIIRSGAGYGGEAQVEWIDPDPYSSRPLSFDDESDTGGWSAFRR